MTLQTLIAKLKEDFEHDKYEQAQEDAGELGRQIELIISDMLRYNDGSLVIQSGVFDRAGYKQVAQVLLKEMATGTLTGEYKNSTLEVYRCLIKYANKDET